MAGLENGKRLRTSHDLDQRERKCEEEERYALLEMLQKRDQLHRNLRETAKAHYAVDRRNANVGETFDRRAAKEDDELRNAFSKRSDSQVVDELAKRSCHPVVPSRSDALKQSLLLAERKVEVELMTEEEGKRERRPGHVVRKDDGRVGRAFAMKKWGALSEVLEAGDAPRTLGLIHRRGFDGEAIKLGSLTFAESSGTSVGVRFCCAIAVAVCSS